MGCQNSAIVEPREDLPRERARTFDMPTSLQNLILATTTGYKFDRNHGAQSLVKIFPANYFIDCVTPAAGREQNLLLCVDP